MYIYLSHVYIYTMLPAYTDDFYLFPSNLDTFLFLFLILLLWLGLLILCWIEVIRVGFLAMFQVLEGSLLSFHNWLLYWLWVCHSFYYFEICSLYTHFYTEWIFTMNVVKCFFCIYWDDYVIFVFCSCGISYWLICMLNHPCELGMNPTWSWCILLCAVGFSLLIF